MVILILVAIVALVILLWQGSNLLAAIFGAPTVNVDRRVVSEALKIARLKKGERFVDLGSGSGVALSEAAKLGARCTGYEISPFYYLYSKIRTCPKSNINIRYKNIFDADVSAANVVYCYLLPPVLKKLAPKFKKELKSGARLISISFPVPGLKLIQKSSINNRTIYVYHNCQN